MSFKTRTIRKTPPRRRSSGKAVALLKKLKPLSQPLFSRLRGGNGGVFRYVWVGLVLLLASWVVLKVTFGAYHLVTNFKATAKEVVFDLGTDLKTDKYGYTNIALLGDGGFRRGGAGLVDTIMVASLDHKKKAVTLLSVPRDYYVGRTGVGIGKINEVYVANKNDLGYEAYQEVLGEMVNLNLHYYVRVDFNAFVEIVDRLGGITVTVKEGIADYKYPNRTDTAFDPFIIRAGVQEMDGETALKFARSRHTTSDYDRASRQQQILGAIQQKALSMDVLTSPSTLKKVFDSVQENMDTNMSWRELLSLAKFGDSFDRSRLVMKVLSTYSGQDGGFLYDGSREVYGGAVVLPQGNNFNLIHRYANLIFHHRELYFDAPKIEILNATRKSGVANQVASTLSQFGFNVVDTGNFLDPEGKRQYAEETLLFYNEWTQEPSSAKAKAGKVLPTHQPTLEALSDFLSFVSLPGKRQNPQLHVDLTLVLGADYQELSLKPETQER